MLAKSSGKRPHRHAIEPVSRRWRGGHDSAAAKTRLDNLIYALCFDFAERPFAERPAYFVLAYLLLGGHRLARADGCRNGTLAWEAGVARVEQGYELRAQLV